MILNYVNSENLPAPKLPDQEVQSSSSAVEHSSGECVQPNDPEIENKLVSFSQEALNYLCKVLYLTKEKLLSVSENDMSNQGQLTRVLYFRGGNGENVWRTA
ncbi:Hypothetical predicted protein [Octopus vulgaris]|uniref:Uncharacterized protein n=1 Tax=Octopus vulgaris TaxID=6645 RepID=A0AA36EX50_OCTVU|nr:Hypothetical predicted protein [Octopus vulgaris]